MKIVRFIAMLRAFRTDRTGNFAILFAASALPLFIAASLAVDITHAFADRAAMSNALDAAILSTTKALSVSQVEPEEASDYLEKVFAGNMAASNSVTGSKVASVKVDSLTNTVTAEATYTYNASFGIFGDAGSFPLTANAAATYGDGFAEVAMAFDLTGSMRGSKIAALQTAAKAGIQKLLSANTGGQDRIRVAAVPYAAAVNVGPDLAKYVYPDDGGPDTVAPDYSPDVTQAAPPDDCATERKGPEQFTDDGPDKGMINRDARLDENSSCPTAQIVPLTTDENKLLEEVKNFRANGTTAGQIGIQWTWYMLSHNWAAFMPDGVGANAPNKKLHKYAVIMTDGEFNTAYAGVDKDANVSRQADTSSSDAVTLCTAMKAKGIQIFTVGFDLDEEGAENTLKACASPDQNGMTFFYKASTGTELAGVYQEIAAMIQKLRLVS